MASKRDVVIRFRATTRTRSRYRKQAKAAGLSLTAWIYEACEQRILRDTEDANHARRTEKRRTSASARGWGW